METTPALRKARLVLALAACLAPRALPAHVDLLAPRELAAASPHVVVAVVEGRESRWNPQRTLLFTDYALRVEDRLRGLAPDRLTVAVPGGTLDGVTDETCLSVRLAPGARYLLFLGDLDPSGLSSITGAAQGAFREIPDPAGSRIAAGENPAPLTLEGRDLRFDDFVAAMRALVAEVAAEPPPAPPSLARKGDLPAKVYDPSSVRPHTKTGGLQATRQPFVYDELAPAPIVVNPMPRDSAFSPADQEQMAYWNLYGGDLFLSLLAPTNTWAFGNLVFDLAGFPDDIQMKAQFDKTWREIGPSVIGVTFSRRRDGIIVEADVALNPAYDWTLDDGEATRRSGPLSFQEVMLHELGHVWGSKHPWQTQEVEWDSVMNYKSRLYYLHTLTADDAAAVRAAFPGVAIRDGMISSYTTALTILGASPRYLPSLPAPVAVRRGAAFNLAQPIKVENPGTVPLSRFSVEVYLTPQRFSFERAIRVKTIRFRGTLPPEAVQPIAVGRIVVPRTVPPGTYWLGFLLRDPRDAYPRNNGAWSNDESTVQVKK